LGATAEQVREARERLLAAGSVEGADGRRHELFPVAIGPEEGLALLRWVEHEGARQTLEIGLGYAIATLFIFEGLLANGRDAHHLATDPYQLDAAPHHRTRFAGIGLQILEDAGVRDLVEFHAEESQILLPRLLAEGRRFDLAFVDGNHRFEAVVLDLIYSARLLAEPGVVFVDDVQLPGVRAAVDFGVANLEWTVEEEGSEGESHSWCVLRTGPADAFARPFDAFVPF
jgi:predicted O-methyltransferase YrrM